MTYDVNASMWTRMHKNEIEELNEIVSSEYMQEMELGRKLRLIEIAKQKLNKAINGFAFDTVINFMTANNWKWSYTKNGEAVPTQEDFINHFNKELKYALFEMIECNKNEFWSSTGGVDFCLKCTNLHSPSEDNIYCHLAFDISYFHPEDY